MKSIVLCNQYILIHRKSNSSISLVVCKRIWNCMLGAIWGESRTENIKIVQCSATAEECPGDREAPGYITWAWCEHASLLLAFYTMNWWALPFLLVDCPVMHSNCTHLHSSIQFLGFRSSRLWGLCCVLSVSCCVHLRQVSPRTEGQAR